jgi:hypothetical protein
VERTNPAGRNPVGGTGKAERRRTQGPARRLRRQAQRCSVKVGGKGSNDGISVIQADRSAGSDGILYPRNQRRLSTRAKSRAESERTAKRYYTRKLSMLLDFQVATPQPKKSVSSVQIGQPRASAAARIGQSSGSRAPSLFRASVSKSP